MSTTASAHPNIALIKYWGKQPRPGNIPVAPSLSITLDTLTSTTTVAARHHQDEILLDQQLVADAKIQACLNNVRARYGIPPVSVTTTNNFPTAAGLASSASGFAALITAINAEFDLGMTASQRSDFARQASGSAARSIYGGYVTLNAPDWTAQPLLDASEWPLAVVIAVTDSARKAVSSSEGMRRSQASPYFQGWVDSTNVDFQAAVSAVRNRNFDDLADLAEASCLKMHGLMLSTPPGLIYWNPATLACVQAVRGLRGQGVPVFFTIDAGPQVKAVCPADVAQQVQTALTAVPGVQRTLRVGLGNGASIIARNSS